MAATGSAALDDLRVLDISSEVAGPYCAKVFGDYGADVIKIEPPGGESGRMLAPFLDNQPGPERSGFFALLNLNKRGIMLDLESDSGREAFLGLVRQSDVVIESFRPGYLDSIGLGFGALERAKPGIVLTSITPYGQTAPWSEREGNDLTAFAMALWAEINQVEGMAPLKGAGYNASFVAGIAGYVSTLAAVRYSKQHGIGQQVDVSVVEAIAALVAPTFYAAQTRPPMPRRAGGDRLTKVKDGYMSLTLGLTRFLDQAWLEFGLPDVDEGRHLWESGNRGQLMQQIGEAVADREKYELFFKLLELQCPAGMALTTEDLFSDPHFRERGFWQEVDQPGMGKIEVPGPSFHMAQTPFAIRRPAPRLGEHTTEVLQELLGMNEKDVAELTRAGDAGGVRA